MIGQNDLKSNINTLIENETFPKFTILVGQEGSGKKLICKYIANKLGVYENVCGITVEDIRSTIEVANRVIVPTLYVIPDADKMSQAAKNALLKITEEPPKNAYFILTLTDLNNTLTTIKSRGTVLHMNPYSVDEIDCYYTCNYPTYEDERKIVDDLCVTPGEVDKLLDMGVVDFYEYVVKVVDNIATVSGSNSFKIGEQLQFKDTTEQKYDLKLFLKAFMSICADRLNDDVYKYSCGIKITSKYLQDLRILGINKQSTFDMWLLDIRKEWM